MVLTQLAIALTAALAVVLIALLWQAERSMSLGADIALVAVLAALAAASRVLTAVLPNVQPMTVLMLLVGMHLGARRGAAVATLATLLANMALGHGPWTLYQAIGWSGVAVSGRLLRGWLVSDDGRSIRVGRLAVIGFLAGPLFDWWVSVAALAIFDSVPLFLTYLLSGLVFDLLHAVGNVAFAVWLGPTLHQLLWLHQRHRAGSWRPRPPAAPSPTAPGEPS